MQVSFFPTLTCGVFVFSSVSAPSFPSLLPHSLSHSLTHSLTRSLTHSLQHHSLSHTHTPHSLTSASLTLPHTHTTPHTLTHARTHARTHSPTHSLTHSLTRCQGVGCTPWRPSGVPLVPFGLRRFCVAGVAQRALPRGRMYALASLWRPSGVPLVPFGLRRFCVAGVAQTHPPSPLSLSLEKLVTCGVIRSYNLVLIRYIQWLNYFLSSRSIGWPSKLPSAPFTTEKKKGFWLYPTIYPLFLAIISPLYHHNSPYIST